jgi:outer membrane protein TolC
MIRFAFSLLLASAVLLAGARAGDDAAGHRVLRLTLPQAIRFALAKNFSLRAEKFGPRIAKENLRSAYGRFDPVLDVTYLHGTDTTRDELVRDTLSDTIRRVGVGSSSEDDALSVGVSGITSWGMSYDVGLTARRHNTGVATSVGDLYTHEVTASINQPLLRGAGTEVNLAGVRTARNNLKISDWALKDRIITVITDTIVVYNDLYFTVQNLDVARRSRNLAQQLLEDNKKRLNAGIMIPLDVTTAQSEVASREEAVIRAERDVKDQENFLKQLITDDLIPLIGTEVEIAPPKAPNYLENVIAGVREALELRPDYRQAKLNIENQKITVAVQKNALLPQLDLNASLNLLGIGTDFFESAGRVTSRDQHSWSAGAVFRLPLGNRDALGKYNAATLAAAQLLVQLQQLEQNIIVLIDNANGAVVTAKKRIDATHEATRLAKESLDAGEKRLAAGTISVFDVLQLQRDFSQAETAELRARADFNQAVARFQQQTGTTLRTHKVTSLGD